MSPFQILGLPHDADEPTIKRAYARLLKQHRPDEDPAGFQRINEAFQACIAQARYAVSAGVDVGYDEDEHEAEVEAESAESTDDPRDRAGNYFPADGAGFRLSADALDELLTKPAPATNDDSDTDLAPPGATAEVTATSREDRDERDTISFDLGAFVDELLQRDGEGHASVRGWLFGHEALYSLELKEAIVAPLVQHLLQRERRMSADGLAVVLDFFHLDTVHNGHPWLTHAVEALRYNSLAAAHFDALVAENSRGYRSTPIDRLMLGELVGPLKPPRRLFLALVPMLPTRVMQLLARLREADADYANERLNLGSVRWWELLTDQRRIDPRRAAFALARIVPLAFAVAWWATGTAGITTNLWQSFVGSALSLVGLWLVNALATMARIRAGEWQQRHPAIHLRSLACLGLVVLAVAVGIGIDPAMSLYLFIVAGWLLVVNPPMLARRLALVAVLTCTIAFMALAFSAGLADEHFGACFVASLAGSFLVILANDYSYARENGITLPQARQERGWIVRVIIANVITTALVIAGAIRLASD